MQFRRAHFRFCSLTKFSREYYIYNLSKKAATFITVDTLIYGPQDEKAKNNLKDVDLLNMFTKVQQVDKADLNTVKSLLKAYIFQKETQARLAQ